MFIMLVIIVTESNSSRAFLHFFAVSGWQHAGDWPTEVGKRSLTRPDATARVRRAGTGSPPHRPARRRTAARRRGFAGKGSPMNVKSLLAVAGAFALVGVLSGCASSGYGRKTSPAASVNVPPRMSSLPPAGGISSTTLPGNTTASSRLTAGTSRGEPIAASKSSDTNLPGRVEQASAPPPVPPPTRPTLPGADERPPSGTMPNMPSLPLTSGSAPLRNETRYPQLPMNPLPPGAGN